MQHEVWPAVAAEVHGIHPLDPVFARREDDAGVGARVREGAVATIEEKLEGDGVADAVGRDV
jgi:hypothetical protein